MIGKTFRYHNQFRIILTKIKTAGLQRKMLNSQIHNFDLSDQDDIDEFHSLVIDHILIIGSFLLAGFLFSIIILFIEINHIFHFFSMSSR